MRLCPKTLFLGNLMIIDADSFAVIVNIKYDVRPLFNTKTVKIHTCILIYLLRYGTRIHFLGHPIYNLMCQNVFLMSK